MNLQFTLTDQGLRHSQGLIRAAHAIPTQTLVDMVQALETRSGAIDDSDSTKISETRRQEYITAAKNLLAYREGGAL